MFIYLLTYLLNYVISNFLNSQLVEDFGKSVLLDYVITQTSYRTFYMRWSLLDPTTP